MNIYVGNLAYEVTESDLREAFAQFGAIASVKIITDSYSGRSKGFGFVEMEEAGDAEQAIAALNGVELKGRTIVVNPARPKEERSSRPSGPRRDSRGPRSGGGRGSYGGGGGGGRGDRRSY